MVASESFVCCDPFLESIVNLLVLLPLSFSLPLSLSIDPVNEMHSQEEEFPHAVSLAYFYCGDGVGMTIYCYFWASPKTLSFSYQ